MHSKCHLAYIYNYQITNQICISSKQFISMLHATWKCEPNWLEILRRTRVDNKWIVQFIIHMKDCAVYGPYSDGNKAKASILCEHNTQKHVNKTHALCGTQVKTLCSSAFTGCLKAKQPRKLLSLHFRVLCREKTTSEAISRAWT
jgi:hypothetical protein